MDMIRSLPSIDGLSKKQIMEVLLNEEYGFLPPPPSSTVSFVERVDDSFCAGKAELQKIRLTCQMERGNFSFPVYFAYPKKANGAVPCFIHINFYDSVPNRYQPTEEIIDNGYATLTFCYRDITSDDGDFSDGLSGIVYPNGKKKENDCGKLGLWAWAAMRVMDFAQTLDVLDRDRISVVGHSRLGKTALLTGALDERFFCAISNDSGCGGASLARGNTGEKIIDITRTFPYWFCENYSKYAKREEEMPFDQHFLIAANYPHRVYVASAEGDGWACPKNEYIACVAASGYYESRGVRGFVREGDELPGAEKSLHGGYIGYHIRGGLHYLGRADWNEFIKYLDSAEK